MPTHLSGRYAIVGIGETELGNLEGRTTLDLHLQAMRNAMLDAGLTRGEIDGLLSNQPVHDPHRSYTTYLAAAMGLNVTFATDLALGGATPIAMAQTAAMAIEAGMCHTVLCVHARNQKSIRSVAKKGTPVRNGNEEFEQPFGLIAATAEHALAAARHMHEFGTTSEQLGAIAVAQRKHACLNPSATMREPITIEDHQNSRWIVEPLHLLDCCLNSDGGGAFIVTSRERAKNLRKKPVYILGMGQHHPQNNLMDAPSLTTLGGRVSSQRAFAMAGVAPKDIDVAEIYDCFTITVLITLEDYGFCEKGEGGEFVQNGRIEIGGELPVNTHGGLLSQAHIEGMLHVTEAVRQLRGDEAEPERQVKDARLAVVSGHGGSCSTHATLVLGTE